MRTLEEKLTLIDETVKFYGENPLEKRATMYNLLSGSSCKYLTEDNKKCAVGRCLTNEALSEHGKFSGTIHGLVGGTDNIKLQNLFKDEYKGFDVDFWQELQRLHDKETNWDLRNRTLSKSGQQFVRDFKDNVRVIDKREQVVLS